MSYSQIAVLFTGVPASEQMPMAIPGLQTLCGEDFMAQKYAAMNESIGEWQINEKSFSMLLQAMEDEQFAEMEKALYGFAPNTDATYESNLKLLGDAEAAAPASINFYAKDFESKDNIEAFISEYNNAQTDETKKIEYTDIIGIMMSSVSIIINVISYVLIAFVSISLVVSSIMIGIITYISVLERTKEIGILRSIGASKKDISRVFNAETLIVGLAAGIIGIGSTLLLCIPINAIVQALTGIPTINAVLPFVGAIALIIISVLLTFIAGLIPSRIAAKKDPVEALRSE
jgi:putative ABC transport system permease protein